MTFYWPLFWAAILPWDLITEVFPVHVPIVPCHCPFGAVHKDGGCASRRNEVAAAVPSTLTIGARRGCYPLGCTARGFWERLFPPVWPTLALPSSAATRMERPCWPAPAAKFLSTKRTCRRSFGATFE